MKRHPILKDRRFLQAFFSHAIHLIAPASSGSPDILRALGELSELNIHIPKSLLAKGIPYHANSDQERLRLFKAAIRDPKTDILWALRGGYGSARLIEQLAKMKKPKKEKYFIGSSDITALHLFLSQHWGWKTIHASGLQGLFNPTLSLTTFKALADILTHQYPILLKNLKPLNEKAATRRKITGELTGGNATLVQNSMGTCWEMDPQKKIIFLEDVNEPAYKIDRLLLHIKQAGGFNAAKAIVFGDFSGPSDTTFTLKRFAQEIKLPVFKTNQFGHGQKNHPLIYLSQCEIKENTLAMNL